MKKPLSDLLSYPFENGLVEPLYKDSTSLFINCLPNVYFEDLENTEVLNFYANQIEMWRKHNGKIIYNLDKQKYEQIFCVLPKNKIEAFYFISLIAKFLQKNGRATIVAANDLGGKSLPKWLNLFGFVGEDFSKQKSRIFVGTLKIPNNDAIQKSYKTGSMQETELGGHLLTTQAGIFGWNKVDCGSVLLINSIDDNLSGIGADFGCGYGYLSCEILSKYQNIKKLYAVDIDYRAIECCKRNLDNFDADILYCWSDLTQDITFKDKLDWIIMNPPFHEGKDKNTNLGIKLIEYSHEALKKNGVIYIVANKHLPYEKTLSLFFDVRKLKEEGGFKVFKATK